jgi:hypothetical protein
MSGCNRWLQETGGRMKAGLAANESREAKELGGEVHAWMRLLEIDIPDF